MIYSQLEMVNISTQHAVSLQIKGYVMKIMRQIGFLEFLQLKHLVVNSVFICRGDYA